MRNPLVILWLVIIFSATGFANIVYLYRQRNESVEFTCTPTKEDRTPFAFSLVRELVKQDKVLYLHFGNKPAIFNDADKHRILAQSDMGHRTANVSIVHLLGRHTGLYRCVFYYDSMDFEEYPGKTVFFLYVEDPVPEVCTCYSYKPLLYALSAAAVLLFICVLILAGVYCKRPPNHPKPLAVPIYEEMSGVRTANGKVGSDHLSLYPTEQEETETYIRPRKENPYDPSPGSDPYSI